MQNGNPGAILGSSTSQYEIISVNGQAAEVNYYEYVFDQAGEYFVRNSGVTTTSAACAGGAPNQCDGIFTVEWEDAIYGPAASPCVDCNGPL